MLVDIWKKKERKTSLYCRKYGWYQ